MNAHLKSPIIKNKNPRDKSGVSIFCQVDPWNHTDGFWFASPERDVRNWRALTRSFNWMVACRLI